MVSLEQCWRIERGASMRRGRALAELPPAGHHLARLSLLWTRGRAACLAAARFAFRHLVGGPPLEVLLPRRQLINQTCGGIILHETIRRQKQVIWHGLQSDL